jgi:hypothetical protein
MVWSQVWWPSPVLLAISGGRDLEDHSSKPVWAKSSRDPPILTNKKDGHGGVCLSFQPSKMILVQAIMGINTRPYPKN